MPIPLSTIDGILPPFVGALGPGDARSAMTPYPATAHEVAVRFGGTERRREILHGWLGYRAALRAAGLVSGFQWIDGSFVEDKVPNDIDVVTFTYSTPAMRDPAQRATWAAAHGFLLDRAAAKQRYKVDAFTIDMNGNPELLVDLSRYYGALFSHRRGDNLWKGMLSVRLEDTADDRAALAAIAPPAVAGVAGAAP